MILFRPISFAIAVLRRCSLKRSFARYTFPISLPDNIQFISCISAADLQGWHLRLFLFLLIADDAVAVMPASFVGTVKRASSYIVAAAYSLFSSVSFTQNAREFFFPFSSDDPFQAGLGFKHLAACDGGRISVRFSGTEPLLRIIAEMKEQEEA